MIVLIQSGGLGHANRPPVALRPLPSHGRKHLIPHRIVNNAYLRPTSLDIRDGNTEVRNTVRIVVGRIQRIDHPEMIGQHVTAELRLLSQHRVLGKRLQDNSRNALFRFQIGLCHDILRALFLVDRWRAHSAASENLRCFASGPLGATFRMRSASAVGALLCLVSRLGPIACPNAAAKF